VLAALEVERFRRKMLDTSNIHLKTNASGGTVTAAQVTAQTLESLVAHDAATSESRALDNAWRGAEAYHLIMLATRQLYRGQLEKALRTSLKCSQYEDILDAREVYSLIAVAAYYTKHFEQCSRACIVLESLDTVSGQEKQSLDQLTLSIFSETRPIDPSTRPTPCPSCKHPVKEWATRCDHCNRTLPTCMMSGATILDHRTYLCKVCRHSCIEHEIRDHVENCPLCHAPIT
jgi:WD repeat-containing protein 35